MLRAAALPLLLLAALSACADPEPPGQPNEQLLDRAALLIVAPASMHAPLKPLVEWKRQSGLPTRLASLEQILQEEAGVDDAAKLRAYVEREWKKGDLTHLLIVGDAGVAPVRTVHTEANVEAESTYVEADVASDLYFADLDGPWDPDGDGAYGELADSADLLPDIAVGRLPVDTPEEVAIFVEKLLRYERNPRADYEHRALLVGEYAGQGVYGSTGLELFIATRLPAELELTRLYEDHAAHPGSKPLTAESFKAALAQGQNLTFLMGHGMETTLGPLTGAAEIGAIDNAERPNVFITTECYGGRFDYAEADSAAEELVKGAAGGVAYVGSTDFGIGFPSFSTVMRELTGCLFAAGDAAPELGGCLKAALRKYSTVELLHTKDHPDRWTQFVTVLLGDPSLRLWTRRPRAVELAIDSHGSCRWVDFTVIAGGEPVAGATVSAYLPGELLLVSSTDELGRATLVHDSCDLAEASITVSGKNIVPSSRRGF